MKFEPLIIKINGPNRSNNLLDFAKQRTYWSFISALSKIIAQNIRTK